LATPAEASRSLANRVGAYALHSKYDSRELTKPARVKFDQRFLDEVDPDRVLPEAERLRRAGHARKAYFARLALLSAKARKKAASP
jgi:hypothetical protein